MRLSDIPVEQWPSLIGRSASMQGYEGVIGVYSGPGNEEGRWKTFFLHNHSGVTPNGWDNEDRSGFKWAFPFSEDDSDAYDCNVLVDRQGLNSNTTTNTKVDVSRLLEEETITLNTNL